MLCYVAYLTLEQDLVNSWPVAVGTIIESKWTGPYQGHHMVVKYTYKVDGIQYSSSMISPTYKDGNFFPVHLDGRLKKNQKVDVCYSAKDHSKSYLKGFYNYMFLLVIGGMGAFVTFAGTLVALGIPKRAQS